MGMSMTVESGEEAKRIDMLSVNPYDLVLLEGKRGRSAPPSAERIRNLAQNIFEYGQLQPVVGRKMPDGKVQLVAGFCRVAAVRLIRDKFIAEDGTEIYDPTFRVKVVIAKCDDQKALVFNIVENSQRSEATPIDIAQGIDALVNEGMQKKDIAKLYGFHPSEATRHHSLLKCVQDIQDRLAAATIAVSTAIRIMEVATEQCITQEEVLVGAQLLAGNDTLTVKDVNKFNAALAREKRSTSTETTPEPPAVSAEPLPNHVLRDDKPTVNWDAEEGQLLAESDAELAEMEASGIMDADADVPVITEVFGKVAGAGVSAPITTTDKSKPSASKLGCPTLRDVLNCIDELASKNKKYVNLSNAFHSYADNDSTCQEFQDDIKAFCGK